MRSSTFLLLATIAALLPAAAAVQARIVTDVNAADLKPLCASTDDPEQCLALVDLYTATNGDKCNQQRLAG